MHSCNHSPYRAQPEGPRMRADIGRTLQTSVAVVSTSRTNKGTRIDTQLGLRCQNKEIYENTVSINWKIAISFKDLSSFEYPLRTSGTLRLSRVLELSGIASFGVQMSANGSN